MGKGGGQPEPGPGTRLGHLRPGAGYTTKGTVEGSGFNSLRREEAHWRRVPEEGAGRGVEESGRGGCL
jgi:hypothetical protein